MKPHLQYEQNRGEKETETTMVGAMLLIVIEKTENELKQKIG